MSWIDENKGAGPWDFIEQPDKWGYLNNPRWSAQQDAIDFCEAKGLSLDDSGQHKPCGHWHKRSDDEEMISIGSDYWWQQSIDVLDGDIGLVAQHYDGIASLNKIIAVLYKDGKWKCLDVIDNAYVLYAVPNTCRLSSNGYLAFYYARWDEVDSNYEMRLYIFKSGQKSRYTDVWKANWDTGIPYRVLDFYHYNVMDCVGSRIACVAMVYKKDGLSYNRGMVKVSNDEGLTFPIEWSFPVHYRLNEIALRMSLDGIVWIARVDARPDPLVTNIQLWKSNSAATNFTKIWEKDFYADINNTSWSPNITFSVSDKDGQYITIRVIGDIAYQVIYSSTDYGINFTSHRQWPSIYTMWTVGTASSQYIVIPVNRLSDGKKIFIRSNDHGMSFSDVDPTPITLSPYYVEQQKHKNEIVYAECGASFSPPAPSVYYISVLYSDNDGATWKVIQTPIQNSELPNEQFMVHSGFYSISDEPQIWPMPE